jgi:hypothetical protein
MDASVRHVLAQAGAPVGAEPAPEHSQLPAPATLPGGEEE